MQSDWLSEEDPKWGRSVCHFYFCCHLRFSFNLEKGCIYLTLTYELRHKRQEFNRTGLKQLCYVVKVVLFFALVSFRFQPIWHSKEHSTWRNRKLYAYIPCNSNVLKNSQFGRKHPEQKPDRQVCFFHFSVQPVWGARLYGECAGLRLSFDPEGKWR